MSTTNSAGAAQQKLDFMTLLVTEMQNQNPLEPMDHQQMASQLAQFTQLELTETMNSNIDAMNSTMSTMNQSFEGALLMAGLDYAKSLLGKEVSFYNEDLAQTIQGPVEKLSFKNGEPVLTVNGTIKHNDGSESQEDFVISLNDIEGIYH